MSSEEQQRKAIEENRKDWLRLEAKFGLSSIREELPMCVVMPGFNNNANFRIEANLNSVFAQNYSNFKVVVLNDASTDGSDALYRAYFAFHAIDRQRYAYVENAWRATTLHNLYYGSVRHCAAEAVVLNLDADDELIGRNVLQVFNWAYQTRRAGVVYSNFYFYQQPVAARPGFTEQYSEQERAGSLYREVKMKYSHLRSYRAELARQLDVRDLQDEQGAFFSIAADIALLMPLMELACGRVSKIEGEYSYLYNEGTGLNDVREYHRQVAVDNRVRKQPKYQCHQPFQENMNK